MSDRKSVLAIHLQPGAKSNEIAGFKSGVLYVKVTALPQKGKANLALVEFMAGILNIPKSKIEIVRGHTSRNKLIAIRDLTSDELKDILAKELRCRDFLDISRG